MENQLGILMGYTILVKPSPTRIYNMYIYIYTVYEYIYIYIFIILVGVICLMAPPLMVGYRDGVWH